MQVPAAGLSLSLCETGGNYEVKKDKQQVDSLMVYTTWNVSKERNRCIFDGVAALLATILALNKKEMKIRQLACGRV